jgi:hypothetical protein
MTNRRFYRKTYLYQNNLIPGMKIFKSIFLVTAVFLAFLSCQKELVFDNNGVSAGTFKKDATGDCLPVTVTGVFKVDSVLTNTNFVDVQINASTPGTFEIRSDTINGYSFRKVGSVVFGPNTIRLYPSGKPIATGTNSFTVKYGASTCTFDITVVGAGVLTSAYTLGSTSSICTGATVNGIFTAGIALDPSNTLTVQVNVASTGTYVLSAVTSNGFIFSGSGIFNTTGLQNVTLTGFGTPVTAGITAVVVNNITSSCNFTITVLPAGAGTAAVFTLNGSPNSCTSFAVAGIYTVGSATSVSNTVTLQVTVTTTGAYTITTNANNGITFSKTGIFATTGPQSIILTATGTPAAVGTFNFTPIVGASTCTFAVSFVAAPPLPAGDYFPLTTNSWWSYDFVGRTDTVYNVLFGTKAYNGNTYSEIQENYAGVTNDTAHYRKSGNDYYQWGPTDYYSAYFQFDNIEYKDINFLRENAVTGTVFTPQVFTGTYNSAPASLEYNFKIENANTSITVNGKNYTNVIYVSAAVKLTITGVLTTSVIENDDYYYAKGVGLIKVKYTPTPVVVGGTVLEADIRNYKVF